MVDVRTYVKTGTAGREGIPTFRRVDADRISIQWRQPDGTRLTTQVMTNAEADAFAAELTAFLTVTPEEPEVLTAPVLTGTPGDGKIALNWTLESGDVRRWEVWLNDQWAAELSADSRAWTKTGLTNGAAVSARVVAYGNDAYKNSNTVSLTPAGSAVVIPTPSPSGELILDEQWDTLDTTRWSLYSTPANHSPAPGIRSPSAIKAENGQLTITATYNPTTKVITTGGMSHRFDWAYGEVEVTARIDSDPTNQMSGVCIRWPRGTGAIPGDGELDFWETTHTGRRLKAFLHYAGAQNLQKVVDYGVDSTVMQTVRMSCRPDSIRLWCNGVLKHTETDPAVLSTLQRTGHITLQNDCFGQMKDSQGRVIGYLPLQAPVRMVVDSVKLWS